MNVAPDVMLQDALEGRGGDALRDKIKNDGLSYDDVMPAL